MFWGTLFPQPLWPGNEDSVPAGNSPRPPRSPGPLPRRPPWRGEIVGGSEKTVVKGEGLVHPSLLEEHFRNQDGVGIAGPPLA